MPMYRAGRAIAPWLATIALLLGLSACHHVQLIYQVEGHPIPTAARGMTSAQITEVLVQAAQAQKWLVDRIGPNEIRATEKWQDHVAVVLITQDGSTFSIRYESSTHLSEQNGMIHKRYNERVRKLEAEIERRLYRNP